MAKNHGGARPGAGRKRKVEEQALIERLSPLDDTAYQALEKALKSGESWAVKLFFDYRYGKPVQRQEISGPDGGTIRTSGMVDLSDWTDEEIDNELERLTGLDWQDMMENPDKWKRID